MNSEGGAMFCMGVIVGALFAAFAAVIMAT